MKNNFRIDKTALRLTLRYGREGEKKVRLKGNWPRGDSLSELPPFSLVLQEQKDILAGRLSCEEESYLRSLTLRFRLKFKGGQTCLTTGMPQAPYLCFGDSRSDESFVVARKAPFRQNIRFGFNRRRQIVTIQWQFNRLLSPGTPVALDAVYLRTGKRRDLLTRLVGDISRAVPFEYGKSRRTLWIPPGENGRSMRLKNLEENLSVLERNKLFYDQIRLEGLHPVQGDWQRIHQEFQGKIGFLNRRIEHNGMSPCLAFAPLAVSPEAPVFREHPDWLLESLRGGPLPLLDITRPEVRDHLKQVLETFRHQWGFRNFHLKGLDRLEQPHLRGNSSVEAGQLIRKTLHFFRENIGRGEGLTTEGVAYLAGTGWIDGYDTVPSAEERVKPPELFNRVVKAGLQNGALEKKLWINNPGIYPFGEEAERLPLQIRESLRQLILITGGTLSFSADHCLLGDPGAREIKRTIAAFRPFCEGDVIPLGYAGTKQPALLYNTIGRLGVFNLSKKTQSISLDLAELKETIGAARGSGPIEEGSTSMNTGTLDLILPPYGARIFRF